MKDLEGLYDLGIKIARKAHKGQYRHDGVTAYIKHPFELADMFEDMTDKTIAILHDALEDGEFQGVTEDYIKDAITRAGYADHIPYIIGGLRALTHDDADTYREYVDAIPPRYIKFKIGDITINLADSPTDYQKEKYKKAIKLLLGKI